MRKLWATFWALLLAFMLLGGGGVWWLFNPSARYFEITGMRVDEAEDGSWIVTSARKLPHGDVDADWRISIQVLRPESSYICEMEGRTTYYADAGPVVRYALGSWADDCLDAGPPVTITFSRQVRVFGGLLPLRPLVYQVSLNPEELPVLPSEQ